MMQDNQRLHNLAGAIITMKIEDTDLPTTLHTFSRQLSKDGVQMWIIFSRTEPWVYSFSCKTIKSIEARVVELRASTDTPQCTTLGARVTLKQTHPNVLPLERGLQ